MELQLQAASGWPLTFSQEDLSINGHSFEARIYSERPDNNFLPANGRLDHLVTAAPGDDVRIESGVVQGDEVSVHYDPMIAKLVVHDKVRACEDDAAALMNPRLPFCLRLVGGRV